MNEREHTLATYAGQFAEYLQSQTGVELPPPDTSGAEGLKTRFERLDLALAQIADLASVYGNDQRSDIEPLTTPTAVLAGEYLRSGLSARWQEPAFEGDTSLILVTRDGIALELEGVARAALLSPQPNLTALVERLLEGSPGPE